MKNRAHLKNFFCCCFLETRREKDERQTPFGKKKEENKRPFDGEQPGSQVSLFTKICASTNTQNYVTQKV